MKRLLFTLTFVTLFACRTTVDPSVTSGTSDENRVRDVVEEFEKTWNAHDIDAFSALFAEDADFVNVNGVRWQSRAAIRDAHLTTHKNQFRNSRLTIHDTSVRFLTSGVAVARSVWELNGHTTPSGERAPMRTGILTNVLRKSRGGWTIVVTQNTDIVRPAL